MKWILYFTLFITFSAQANEEIKSINFIQEGDISKLIIRLSGNTIFEQKNIKEDKMILLDLKNVSASKRVLRAIDTSEFKSSVTYISGYQSPTNKSDIRFTINLRDNVRSQIDRKNNNIILSIENRFGVFDTAANGGTGDKFANKTTSADGEDTDLIGDSNLKVPKSDSILDILANLVQAGPKKYIGKKISLNVKDMPMAEILKILSEVSGFNIIVGKDVQKAPDLTLSLTEVPWDEALDTILKLSKLVAEKHSNILVVDTLSNFSKQKEEELKEKLLSQKQEPLVTKVFAISYAKLDDLVKILEEYSTEKRGKITKDERTNNVIVQDTVESIEKMKRVVELLDTQTPQVLIEAKIVEAEENFGQKIGLGDQGVIATGATASGATAPSFTFNSAPRATGATTALSGNIFTNGAFNAFKLSSLVFDLEMMEFNNELKIISSPRVITENKKMAKITSGETINKLVDKATAGGGTESEVEQITAVLDLEVTPNITNDGSIALEVKLKKEGFSDGNDGLNTNNKSVQTSVLVDNGSTIVLGGVYQTEDRAAQSGIPFLKDLPIVGWLFKTANDKSTKKKELIVFITPRIINQEEAGLTSRSQIDESDKSVKE